jgi:hypothetical protein
MRQHFVAVVLLLALSPATLPAQAPRPMLQPGNTVLLAGYKCQADQLARADALIDKVTKGVLDKYVAAGRIISWGYMGVYIGDQTNRQIYVWAADPAALIQARQAYLPEIQANPDFPELTRICGMATITLHNLITASAPPAR